MKARKNKAAQIELKQDQHLQLFYEIQSILSPIEDERGGLQAVAIEANITTQTLVNWLNQKVHCPQLRTLYNVAWVLGYEVVLQKRGKVQMRRVA